MTAIVVLGDHEQMSASEAESIHNQIVSKVTDVRNLLVRMEIEAGWASLGYDSWEAYLVELGKITRAGSKYLRRISNAGLLEADTGHDIGTFKEGTVRPINEILSDSKGFTHENRAVALELAIEIAGGEEELTGPIAQMAAWQIAVIEKTPDVGENLVARMRDGFISSKQAYEIMQVIRSTRGAPIAHILAEVSDPQLARTMANLNSSNGEQWQDIKDTIERTGYMPTSDGNQLPIDSMTNKFLVDYLNAPARMQRHEAIVEESEMFRRIANVAARLMVSYYGVSVHGLPMPININSEMFKIERELYELCQAAGLIRNHKTD